MDTTEKEQASQQNEVLLDVRNLTKYYPIKTNLGRRVIGTVKAVDGVSFQIRKGQSVGLVGESGCGKTTAGRCVLRAIDPTGGEILMHDGEKMVDVLALRRKELRTFRRHMQLIFQDPHSSLNPRMTVMQIIAEPLVIHKLARGRELQQRVRTLMEQVGLDPRYINRYPHAFSGGQRQRIGIARALALHPKLIVADEAVSALDMSMQAQILNLLKDLQRKLDLTYLFITHDLSVVRHFCDHVLVMYAGKLVEIAETQALFTKPMHPYTEALLAAAPHTTMGREENQLVLSGEVPDPAHRPPGCPFHPRCRFVEDRCRSEDPPLREVSVGRQSGCHLTEGLTLTGL